MKLYVEMAERYYLSGKIVESTQIVEKNILKILDHHFLIKLFAICFQLPQASYMFQIKLDMRHDLAKL